MRLKRLWLQLPLLTPLSTWGLPQWCKYGSVFFISPHSNRNTYSCLHLNTIMLTSGSVNYVIFTKTITCVFRRHNPRFIYFGKAGTVALLGLSTSIHPSLILVMISFQNPCEVYSLHLNPPLGKLLEVCLSSPNFYLFTLLLPLFSVLLTILFSVVDQKFDPFLSFKVYYLLLISEPFQPPCVVVFMWPQFK